MFDVAIARFQAVANRELRAVVELENRAMKRRRLAAGEQDCRCGRLSTSFIPRGSLRLPGALCRSIEQRVYAWTDHLKGVVKR